MAKYLIYRWTNALPSRPAFLRPKLQPSLHRPLCPSDLKLIKRPPAFLCIQARLTHTNFSILRQYHTKIIGCVLISSVLCHLSRLEQLRGPLATDFPARSLASAPVVPCIDLPRTNHNIPIQACLPSSTAVMASSISNIKPKTITPLHSPTIITTAVGERLVFQPRRTLNASSEAPRL